MALIVSKNGHKVEKWSTTDEQKIEFNEANEQAKPGTSLYNIEYKMKGLSR